MKRKKPTPKVLIKRNLRAVLLVSLLTSMFLLVVALTADAQQSIVVKSKESYQINSDSLNLADLILEDSSILYLNKTTSATFIHANRVIIGKGVTIMGKGERGAHGDNGKSGIAPKGVCQNGGDGEIGGKGSNGENGKNLLIDSEEIELQGGLHIYLNGGNGGDGGKGGHGSAGSSSSVHCASHGGNGGNGGSGGNGGEGGNFHLQYHKGISLNEFCLRAFLHNNGGYQGLGGEGGKGGAQGVGTNQDASKRGTNGKKGTDGQRGKEGPALFFSVVVASAK